MMEPREGEIARWVLAFGALTGIVIAYTVWFRVNPTTVALTLVLYVLLLATYWSLRYALVVSVAAAAVYNFFFLPPIGTFAISDPQNWLTLSAFLATSVIGSRLSQRVREEAERSRSRQREVELLLALSRELLSANDSSILVRTLPEIIKRITHAESAAVVLDTERVQQGPSQRSGTAELLDARSSAAAGPHGRTPTHVTRIPLRTRVWPRGLLTLTGLHLSSDTFQAIGGLVSIALDGVQAIENAAKSEAKKDSERLRTLILDSITHELRTPLTSIKGAAGALLSSGDMSIDTRQELLLIVDEEADRLNLLIAQAVEMAQLETQEVRMKLASVALPDVVEELRESCAPVFSAHPVSISFPPPLPQVRADPQMVGKVLRNLLENAAKYSPPASPILISAEQMDGYVLTSVTDQGVGIDPAELDLIFYRLYRSPRSSEAMPGTGMGLAISRAIIEAHGGTLSVSSEVNRGSVFTFTLPVAG